MATGGFGTSPNTSLLMLLSVSAVRSIEHLDAYWALQRRHAADDERWIDLAHYLTKDDAASALDRVVEHAHADRHELRVEHIRRRSAS
jgi:hypothetical protein